MERNSKIKYETPDLSLGVVIDDYSILLADSGGVL